MKTEMEIQREALHDILCNIPGVSKVYYQPPASISLKYPCLLYDFSNYTTIYADNIRIYNWPEYTLTLVDKDPESIIHKRIMDLHGNQGCYVRFDRFYTADNLNHWSYNLVFTQKMW